MKKPFGIKLIGNISIFLGFFGSFLAFLYSPVFITCQQYLLVFILFITLLAGGIFLLKLRNWARILCMISMGCYIMIATPFLIKDFKAFPANLLFIIFLSSLFYLILPKITKQFTSKNKPITNQSSGL